MGSTMKKEGVYTAVEALPLPTPWPNANARLLGVGAGLPVPPLVRLAQMNAGEFERLTLEWASDYLSTKLTNVVEVQQRGGAGDKGRDVIVWHDPTSVTPRRWTLYQCKHYAERLGAGAAFGEIGKILYYTFTNLYYAPIEYWFVTHLGLTSNLQDLIDDPEKLRAEVIKGWTKHCSKQITSKTTVHLTAELQKHIENFDFTIFKAKQPLDLVKEHSQTRYHFAVFGAPLIDRPKPPAPPSSVAPSEAKYLAQLYEAIGEDIGAKITNQVGFAHSDFHNRLFDRSRITFYCSEGLKELARDQMADSGFFDTLLDEFQNGLYHSYTEREQSGIQRLRSTIRAAQALQLTGHILEPHVRANDREGMCHQIANERQVKWCGP